MDGTRAAIQLASAQPVEAAGALSLRAVDDGRTICARVHLARSFRGRLLGLMGRAELAPGEGLLLAGTNSIHMLFMRFAIDCVFLSAPAADGTRRVIAVRSGLRPWRGVVWWVRGAAGALELAAGEAARSGIQPGDVVRLEASPAAIVG